MKLYLEALIAAAEQDGEVTSFVVRKLSPTALAALARDLIDAQTNGRPVEDVLTAWETLHQPDTP